MKTILELHNNLQSLVDTYGTQVVQEHMRYFVTIPDKRKKALYPFEPFNSIGLTWSTVLRMCNWGVGSIKTIEDAVDAVKCGFPLCISKYEMRMFGRKSFFELATALIKHGYIKEDEVG